MATKMVLRKQTGHICNECKMSFKAKELLIEHYETCPAMKGVFRPTDAKLKISGTSNPTSGSDASSELGSMLINESISLSHSKIGEKRNLQLNEVTMSASSQFNDIVTENVVITRVVDMGEEVVKLNPSGGAEGIVIPENCVMVHDQTGEQIVASLVDVINVEGIFDNDVCAFEVIEEIVDENPDKTSEALQMKADGKQSDISYSSECMRKLSKKRRLNSGSSGTCEITTSNNNSSSGSNSGCNNTSVYSLCLAAEIASSMETVQAAKSLLGMSLQQGEVETDDSGNVKMVSILRKKPDLNNQAAGHKDLHSNKQSAGIKREVGDHVSSSNAPALNVISKISFLQSLNNRIIGKETDGADLSALITTPVACEAKVKVESEGDDLFVPSTMEKKITRLNFNVLKSGTANSLHVGSRFVGERPKSTFLAPNMARTIYSSHANNHPNIFGSKQTLMPGTSFTSHDAALIPVTNEVEVIAEVVKSEAGPFNPSSGRQYIIQVPSNVSTTSSGLPSPANQISEVKDSSIYVCGLCNKAFDDCENLKIHVEKHIGMERQSSNKTKNSDDRLSEDESACDEDSDEVRKQLGGSKHECRECGMQFQRLSLLKKHAKSEHGGLKAFVCGACNKTFPFACGLKLHAQTHGAERRYSCQFCGRRFKHASNLQKHVKVVHVNACKCRTVECTCGKRDPSSFKIDHACRICGRVCESSKHLEIHHRSHTGEKPEVCQTCGKSFQHKSNLQKHQLKHTGIRPYKCPHCERSFFVKHSFLGHMRLHTRDSPYTCETCGKSFISKNGLQVHSILHQDRLPFCCGQCGREFAQLGNLNKHLSLHTGDKPFPCNFCEKKFVDTSALKRHMVIHTRERNYSCPECGKTFLHFSSLRSHMTTHKFEEQERHQCNLCNKTFNVKSNFMRHMKQHEGPQESEQIEYLVYMQ